LLWGPPGTGKTTLAQVIANTTKLHFETLSAVMAGKAELREVIEKALERRKLYQ
jgi:putative ATPase